VNDTPTPTVAKPALASVSAMSELRNKARYLKNEPEPVDPGSRDYRAISWRDEYGVGDNFNGTDKTKLQSVIVSGTKLEFTKTSLAKEDNKDLASGQSGEGVRDKLPKC
jgi:hypothetical protein